MRLLLRRLHLARTRLTVSILRRLILAESMGLLMRQTQRRVFLLRLVGLLVSPRLGSGLVCSPTSRRVLLRAAAMWSVPLPIRSGT